MKIKFVGAKDGKKPLKQFTDGNDLIVLPENQTKPFAHPSARAILQHSPELYKRVVKRQRKSK